MRRGRDDEVSAALAEVQARQQSLSRGSVLPRAASPPAVAHDTSSPSAVAPLAREKTPQQRPRAFQWIKRRVVRRSDRKDAALEDLGSLEFVPSASLATVRTLVCQFIALPSRREFFFVHLTTNALVELEKENGVAAAQFPFICIALAGKESKAADGDGSPSSEFTGAASAKEMLRFRPVTATPQLQPTHQKASDRPHTVETNTKRRAAETATGVLSTTGTVKMITVPPVAETKKTVRKQAELAPRREGRTLGNSDQSKYDGVLLFQEVGPKTTSGKIKLKVEEPTRSNPEQVVRFETGQATERGVVEKQVIAYRSRSASVRPPNDAENKVSSEPALELPDVRDEHTKLDVAHDKFVSPEPFQDNVGESTTSGSNQDCADEVGLQQPEKPINSLASNTDQQISSKATGSQRPGPLRRSRRFRSTSIVKLLEEGWGVASSEQEEVVFDDQVGELIRDIVEVFYTRLPGVEIHHIDSVCQHYGIDYESLELQGVLLALDNELSARCNHIHGGVEGQLAQYLLKVLPVDFDDKYDLDALRHFERALNLFAGVRGWHAPTRLRETCFEEKQRLQLIPPSDSRRLSLLRLSDKDRQLFHLASVGSSGEGLEKWLGDGLEITYVLLYGFLQSRRNSGPKSLAKLDAIYLRQDRIQAAIQKLSSFSLDVWKRLEFRISDLEDVSMVRRLNALLRVFIRHSKQHAGDVEGSVFFTAIVDYLVRKSDQLAQSLSGFLELDLGKHGSSYDCVTDCVRRLHQQLEQHALHPATTEAHLLDGGLKVIDVEKINAYRANAGLGRIYMCGKESVLTHHQCKLMARDKYLHLKARWQLEELSWGKTFRYFFVDARNIALEYVLVRMKPDHSLGDEIRWDDREVLSRKEAQYAYNLFCGDSLDVPLDVAVGIGINIVHTELLPHISSILSLNTVLREYPETTSVSLGYCYAPATQTTRVVSRVHSNAAKRRGRSNGGEVADKWKLPSIIKEVGAFLSSATEEEAIAFCDAEGLSFLYSCLKEEGGQWRTVVFGLPFFESIHQERNRMCQSEDILQVMKMTISVIPRAFNSITKGNLQILFSLVETLPEHSDVGDEAISALQSICSNIDQPASTELRNRIVVAPMTESQKKFSALGGLGFLVCAAETLRDSPGRKTSIHTAIVDLLRAHEFSLKSGLLVHWREWLEFYVEQKAWATNAATPTFLVYLLSQIHKHFFKQTAFVEPTIETCTCGCQGQSVDIFEACVGVVEIFVRLMLTDVGLTWAQDEMRGPDFCVAFLSWSVASRNDKPRMAELQSLILDSLCAFLECMTSSHQNLRILSLLTPQLLNLLKQQVCPSLHTGTLRVLSLTFRLAVDKKVWLISMELFLAEFYRLTESLCDDPSLSNTNDIMVNVLLNSEYPEHFRCGTNNMLSLFHEEHVNFVGGSGQLSPVARTRTKSLLQTLVSFCSLTWNSALQPYCQIPALICLGWMVTSLDIANDLVELELDELLLTLMECDSTIVSILAIQAYTARLFQGLLSSQPVVDEYRLKRLCNLLTTALRSSTRLMLSPKRGSTTEKSEAIQFAANKHDLYLILLRYSAFNNEKQNRMHQQELEQENSHEVEPFPIQVIWEGSEWNDSSRAGIEKLAASLKLLTVFSAMTRNVVSIGNSDEIRQILVLLVRFIRERAHTANQHITLYLLSLRNIVWATRSELAKWGYLELSEASFLRKLLLLSKDRVHQDLASGIMWGLADAYEKTSIYLLSFEVDDSMTKGIYFTEKTGFAAMVEHLASKISSGRSAENDAGAVVAMIANPFAGDFFNTNFGYSFALKLIDSMLRSTITGQVVDSELTGKDDRGELFGTRLFYDTPINSEKDRELLQLCRIATRSLEFMQRLNTDSILDEAARTRSTVFPLLTHPNKQIALQAIRCYSTHLHAHPTKCGKLFEPDVQDKLISYFFEDGYPPIQAAAFSCLKQALADQKSLSMLQAKLSPYRERIVACLCSPHFQVKQKTLVFLVEAVFRFDDPRFLEEVADAFAAPENQDTLLGLFNSLSKEIELDPAASGLLQLLVRLILKLDLVVHTDGDQLVHGICMTLKAHSTDTFVRPTLFNCLHQIVTQGDRVAFLSKKSRLDVITDLLSQQLTLSELRNIASMLSFVASKHSGIRHYLCGFTSGCIPKILSVLGGFSEYNRDHNATEDSGINHLLSSKGEKGIVDNEITSLESSASLLLKITAPKAVYVSHFTENVYDQFLRLLLFLMKGPEFIVEERYGCLCEEGGCINCDPCDIIAKARCGHLILRLAAAHRISCARYDLASLLSSTGSVTTEILSLCIEVLEILAANYQCRVQMLRGVTKLEWSWLPCLIKTAMLSGFHKQNPDERSTCSACESKVAHSILMLGYLSAAKDVALRLAVDRQFVSALFSYILPRDDLFATDVDIRRASSFTLARLAEQHSVVRDPLFQEQMALLTQSPLPTDTDVLEVELDKIVVANKMVLARNRALLTPGLQGRSAGDETLTRLVSLLQSTQDIASNVDVGLISADVLAHLLYFRVNERDATRLRSVMWSYARAMSPTKPVQDQNHPSSKRLTAYLHSWIGPTLQKLRKSVFGAFRGDSYQLLFDELMYTYQQLSEPSVGELLLILTSLHLHTFFTVEPNTAVVTVSDDLKNAEAVDAITPYEYNHVPCPRERYLQYVFIGLDRSTREPNDYSFLGSVHTWLFLQKLWGLCTDSAISVKEIVYALEKNTPRIFAQWKAVSGTRFSTSAFDRRQCFLEFLVVVGETECGLLNTVDVRTVAEIVIGYGLDSGATIGVEYKLLCLACQHVPKNVEILGKWFNLECDNAHDHTPMSSFCRFWGRVRLDQLPLKLSWPSDVARKITLLDPSPEADIATIFGIDLLKRLSLDTPHIVRWYAQCQGYTELMDMMLLASKVSTLQMTHTLVRTFLSNLLALVNLLVEQDQDRYYRIFELDPRYLRCIVDLIYAPAHQVQMSAIKLLQKLAQQSKLFAMLSRIENLIQPLGIMSADVIIYIGEILNKRQVSPTFTQDHVLMLAHVWYVPFFTDLSVTELVKLSLGFNVCSQPTENTWTLLINDNRFSSIPEWMLESNDREYASFSSTMKQIQKRFHVAVHNQKLKLSMYSIAKEAYIIATSVATRRRIASRLSSLLKTYNDDTNMYQGSVRARNGLVMRLGRLLVEDRAEIIRRVAYTKRMSERSLFEQMQRRQLSDLLTLLQENPLFEGIQRDQLANLAFRMGDPVEFTAEAVPMKQKLPLLVLLDEGIEFEMYGHKDQILLHGAASRGGLLGFPLWLENKPELEGGYTVIHKCGVLGFILSRDVLQSELTEPALNLVDDRLRSAYCIGDTNALSNLVGLKDDCTIHTPARRRLQISASSLLVQLISADIFIDNLLNDSWAIRIIVDIALAALHADVVLNALTVVAAMTINESYTKRFWTKALAARRDRLDVETESRSITPIELVADLVYRFKLRLWQSHPEILKNFFRIQSQIARFLPAFWLNLQEIWPPTYLRNCLALLQSGQHDVMDTVGYHLSSAIPHRMDYLAHCSQKMDLHLELARILSQTRSGRIIGLLRLFNALCLEEDLRENIWESLVTSARSFNGVVQLVAAEIERTIDAGKVGDLEVYCDFIYLMCTSGIDEFIESEFRVAIGSRSDILTVLLTKLQTMSEENLKQLTLRCIGSICIDTPSNCRIAVTTPVSKGDQEEIFLIDVVIKLLVDAEEYLRSHGSVDALLAEATFSCVDAIAFLPDQMDRINPASLVNVAVTVIQSFTVASVSALRAVIRSLFHAIESKHDTFAKVFSEADVSVLILGFEQISSAVSIGADNLQLQRLLKEYTGLLISLLSSRELCDTLWKLWLYNTDLINRFVTWIYLWVVFDATESRSILELTPTRSRKQLRLLEVATQVNDTTMTLATLVGTHEEFSVVLSSHADFGKVIHYIFASFDSCDVLRSTARAKFVCFVAEQWGNKTVFQQQLENQNHLDAVQVIVRHFDIQALVKVCFSIHAQSDVFTCYALRVMWLLAKLNSYLGEMGCATSEYHYVLPLADTILKSPSSSTRTKCNAIGLVSELSSKQTFLSSSPQIADNLTEILRSALTMLTNGSLRMSKETFRFASMSISGNFLSSRTWNQTNDQDNELNFGLFHQTRRFVLHLCQLPETRILLNSVPFFHPLLQRTLFEDSIHVLQIPSVSEVYTTAQVDGLALITILLSWTKDVGSASVIRTYRLIARRERYLFYCIRLLSEPQSSIIQLTVMESLFAYVKCNICACAEVTALREKENEDLMGSLLLMLVANDNTETWMLSSVSILCLQLYNCLIEFSFDNAAYAARPNNLELFAKLQRVTIRHDEILGSDIVRTFFYMARMLRGSILSTNARLSEIIWEIVATQLLHPQIASYLETLECVLKMLQIFVKSGAKALQIMVRDWEEKGKLIVLRLIDFVCLEKVANNGIAEVSGSTTSQLAMNALKNACASETFCDYVNNDPDIISKLVGEYPCNTNLTQLLKNFLQNENVRQNNSLLSQNIVARLDEIVQLEYIHRLNLLDLLPNLVPVLDRDERILSDLLCILGGITDKMDNVEQMIVARAIRSAFENYDFKVLSEEILSEFHVELARLLEIPKPATSSVLMLLDDHEQDSMILMPSELELLLLSSLCKVSLFIGADLPLGDLRAGSCVAMWMGITSSRICNSNDETTINLLCDLMWYYLNTDSRSESATELLKSRHIWLTLTRRFASTPNGSITTLKLMLMLLQGSSKMQFLTFATDVLDLDLIDILWWQVDSTNELDGTEGSERCTVWCLILDELCCSREDALSIMKQGFLKRFIELEQPSTTALLSIVSSVFEVTSPDDHDQFFRQEPTAVKILSELCVSEIAAIPGASESKTNAAEVLYALAMNEDTLFYIQKSCYLEEENVINLRRERICAVSEMLLHCQHDIGDLLRRLALILKVFGSLKGIDTLILARNASDCWPMVDVLVEVLEQCTSSVNSATSSASNLRPIQLTTGHPNEFLPYHQSSDIHTKASIQALQLIHLCAANETFAEAMKMEVDLLQQLFLCVATSRWEISSRAAVILCTVIRCNSMSTGREDVHADIARYICENGLYRKLAFFASLSAQNVFRMSPPSLFPCCFMLLIRWIRFYAVNLPFLEGTQRVLPFQADEDEFPSTVMLQDRKLQDTHERLVASVLEMLLYCVSNFHSEIYKNENNDEEEREHSLLLKSLLTLCQRRTNVAESCSNVFDSTVTDNCIVANGKIRSLSLELVQLLCSLDLPHTSSVQVFTNARQMLILMMMVERSASSIEQRAATRLMQALTLHDSIKKLLIGHTSLLSRLGAWLENDKLNILAAAIFQKLATPSGRTKHAADNKMFRFAPSFQQQLAHFLFVGYQPVVKRAVHSPSPNPLLNDARLVRFVIQLKKDSKDSPRSSSMIGLTIVQLNIELLKRSGQQVRTFQFIGTLQDENDLVQYELLLEQNVNAITCNVAVCTPSGQTESKHYLELPLPVSSLALKHENTVTIRCEEDPVNREKILQHGVIPRLLRPEDDGALDAELFDGLSEVVAEFCKNFDLFCDPIVDLPSQILIVLGTSVNFSPSKRMDLTCLESLVNWFPRKPTISFFKKIISPLMRLLHGFRRLSCVEEHINLIFPSKINEVEIVDNGHIDYGSTQLRFLERFIEMIASVDVPDHTANCLNSIFFDGADILRYLCAQFNPEQDPNATFLSLVAIAIRSNIAHCQTFLAMNAQTVLRSVFDAGTKQCAGQSELSRKNLLCFASLVTVRLARCPTSNHRAMRGSNRLELFSRVSFEIFANHSWGESLPLEAAENIILACGFFNDGLPKLIAVDADTHEAEWFSAFPSDWDVQEDRLTIVETLLLFLGRPHSNDSKGIDSNDGLITFDSFDRLAATVLASLIEKLPAREAMELNVLRLLDARSSRSSDVGNLKRQVDSDSRPGNAYEEQCLLGLRRCLGLTRYDFQSELNILRLTYYSSIRAGVRTGIIPPQCSGAFQRFDQEHLLPTEKPQWHLDDVGLHGRRQSYLRRNSNEHITISSIQHLVGEDSKLESELRELLLYANEHEELVSVLTINRKKAMTAAIRIATRNATILQAFHAMTSIALDFYVDTAKRLQNQQTSGTSIRKTIGQRKFLDTAAQTTFVEWLLLLEELAGLLCSGLHELDAVYYAELARQFHSLIADLPVFLRKMERTGTHSRQQALLLFLDNLHRLLKRATNRNELRVVAASGAGVVDQTKSVRERLRRLDPDISSSLGLLLEMPEGMENLSRALIAMTYTWRRMMVVTSLDKAMATSKESASLLKKMTEKVVGVFRALSRPRKMVRAAFLVVLKFGAKQQTAKSQQFDSPSVYQRTRFDSNSRNTDEAQSGSEIDSNALALSRFGKLVSALPFSSLELALDHFGWESLSAKRTKLLLQNPARKHAVTEVLSVAFSITRESVDRLSVVELAEHFHNLDKEKNAYDVLGRLENNILEDELPFSNLPVVVHDKMNMSLWRLMVRPIQRIKIFHLYQQLQYFVVANEARRQRLLEGYHHVSPQKPILLSEVPNELKPPRTGLINGVQTLVQHDNDIPFPKLFPSPQGRQTIATQMKHEGPFLSKQVTGATISAAKVPIPRTALNVCDSILNQDPLSDDAAMKLLRKKNEDVARKHSQRNKWWSRGWLLDSHRLTQYRSDRHETTVDWMLRLILSLLARLVLVIAFWRQEELRADLSDSTMAQAFDDLRTRDEYYRLYHAKKGLGELFRVWMPSSGRLGLLLWQERRYALGGTFLSVVIALWLPSLVFPDATNDTNASSTASERNTLMTRIVYSYGIAIFSLSVISIARIARNRFLLLEQTRLRLRPISRYYQNALAVTAIAVELVQLNSLAFDPAVDWDETDELPSYFQWLGHQGITKFGVSSASELQAIGILLLLISWFLMLKCANKFQDTSVLLHRVLTKDLPALVNGFFYMGTISAFFSFLACIDCSHQHNSTVKKCISASQSSPFLIAHPSITCWTPTHQWYALLGLWGITFFLPIGLLAHGMSQVLFQRETLDIKYAPVLLLVTQLVKAVAATAQAFFPFNPLVLASLGLIGNGVLLGLTLVMHSCSLWYIKYVKCSIYAASCWASLGAIHRVHYADQSSTRSLNMIYFGWLSIGLVTATAILLRVWRRARAKERESELRFAAQQRLINAETSVGTLGVVEQKFMKAAKKHLTDEFTRAAFVSNATRLRVSDPPPVLKDFLTRAKDVRERETMQNGLFIQNARVMAKKLREQEGLRKRR